MAAKKVEIAELGIVHLYKRRGTKSMRLSVTHAGEIRVSIPYWVPYNAGVEFARTRKDWVMEHRQAPMFLRSGQQIGKAHRLVLQPGNNSRIVTRLNAQGEVVVFFPSNLANTDHLVQAAAQRASIRALKLQAETLLPQRLRSLAITHGYSYSSVTIKRLSSRWGSCSSNHEITLNCFLMQLPWHLIDYVLLHELAHTRVMAHGPTFWAEVSSRVANIKTIRKDIKHYQPKLLTSN